jgi:hypothetical protein
MLQERVMRDVIRSTWGKEVVLLGAKVFFVFGNTIRQYAPLSTIMQNPFSECHCFRASIN